MIRKTDPIGPSEGFALMESATVPRMAFGWCRHLYGNVPAVTKVNVNACR
jgi:hypothetical protein